MRFFVNVAEAEGSEAEGSLLQITNKRVIAIFSQARKGSVPNGTYLSSLNTKGREKYVLQ